MAKSLIITEYINNGILVLKISDPPYNLISNEFLLQLQTVLTETQQNKKVRCVVITSVVENIFSAGANIKEFPTTAGKGEERSKLRHVIYNMLEDLPQPTIAALNGNAFGGGLELALACDIRIAKENAKLGLTELRFGIFPAGGGTYRLTRLIGEMHAKEMIFFHRIVSSDQAYKIGLVSEVAKEEDFWTNTLYIAQQLAKESPLAIQSAKRAINLGVQHGKSISERSEELLIDEVFTKGDVQEGIRAFLEKREPEFHAIESSNKEPGRSLTSN